MLELSSERSLFSTCSSWLIIYLFVVFVVIFSVYSISFQLVCLKFCLFYFWFYHQNHCHYIWWWICNRWWCFKFQLKFAFSNFLFCTVFRDNTFAAMTCSTSRLNSFREKSQHCYWFDWTLCLALVCSCPALLDLQHLHEERFHQCTTLNKPSCLNKEDNCTVP